MKKPAVIDNIEPPKFLDKHIRKPKKGDDPVYLGEVQTWRLETNHHTAALEILAARLPFYGLKLAGRLGYSQSEVIKVNGAVGLHTDPGLGLLLVWFLGSYDYYPTYMGPGEPPFLATKWGVQRLEHGDVFLFNGDEPHAWIHNGCCFLAQITVSKIRSKGGDCAKIEV